MRNITRQTNVLTRTGIITTLLVGFILAGLILPKPAQALSGNEFQAGRIVDDSVFTNKSTMSIEQIQLFLNAKVPDCRAGHTCLKSYSENGKSAAQIIWEAAQDHGINPQVLVVFLQKEQGLVTDNWPIQRQYDYAMGFGCPDDDQGCRAQYAGFNTQVRRAAQSLRGYFNQDPNFPINYRPGTRNILWHPDRNRCGSSPVNIFNKATAALYIYTPYQPNQAALNNLFGTGDSCSAYGNRNFWRDFNRWFGPTLADDFAVIMSNDGNLTQYVLEGGKRYPIPTAAIKVAWGLGSYEPYVFNSDYVGSIPLGPALGRIVRPNGTLSIYFVDNGYRYRFGSVEAMNVWGYNTSSIIDVPAGIGNRPTDAGDIGFIVSNPSDQRIHLVDGGSLRHITDPNVLTAWAGDSPIIVGLSSDYFNSSAQGSALTTIKITDGSAQYVINNWRKLKLSNITNQLYPAWATYTISAALANYMGTDTATSFVKTANAPQVYLVDQSKHHVIDPGVLSAWGGNTSGAVNVINQGFLNVLPSGVAISDYFAGNGNNYFVIDGGKRAIPASLASAYTSTRTVYQASTTLLDSIGNGSAVSGFVRATGQPQTYILTNSGVLRHMTSSVKLQLWNGNQPVTELTDSIVNRYTNQGGIGALVRDATTDYVMEAGKKHAVSAGVKTAWKLTNGELITDGTLTRFADGTALAKGLQDNGQYYVIDDGVAYGTVDWNLASVWDIEQAPSLSNLLIQEFLPQQTLTRFARANDPADSRLFVVNDGILYHLSPEHARNLGHNGAFTMYVKPDTISKQPVGVWGGIVVKTASSTPYVIDGGGKRTFNHHVIFDQWTNGGTAFIPVVTDGFVSLLPNRGSIERAIKGSGPAVYSAQSITKRWILSTQTYSNYYAPYLIVSDALISVLPNGENIP